MKREWLEISVESDDGEALLVFPEALLDNLSKTEAHDS
jgi:hypothetical protein